MKNSILSLLIFAVLEVAFGSEHNRTGASSHYYSKYPRRPYYVMYFANDKMGRLVKIDLHRPYSFIFGQECFEINKCSTNSHGLPYNATRSKSQPITNAYLQEPPQIFSNHFTGQFYNDSLWLNDDSLPLDVAVITDGNRQESFEWDGVLGLGLDFGRPDLNTLAVEKLFDNYDQRRILIQQGHNYISRTKQTIKGYKHLLSEGVITFGNDSSPLCEEFDYYNTKNGKTWQLVADVFIGFDIYYNQTISFLPGEYTQVPYHVFKKYFISNDTKNPNIFQSEDDLPYLGFTLNGNDYMITKEDYSWVTKARYFDKTNYTLTLESTKSKLYDFGFGSEFLQHYCIALTADEGLKNIQLGLAINNDAYTIVLSLLVAVFFAVLSIMI
ncbi:unnamed protein product [Bursaphelenchus okinawaensis]|uniref:Peptidase A1 domain-containing protein n=1 Tax=Bursaphelenchus okinawaensis TaxID=465554 RepID=A0A811L1D2_9BILA|nr:unnamed protein product [Bursaphelenchus okinawaensis]CAG9115189.1 unnamed protein product [Bursaphelenchus okinawaensis]